MLSLLALSLQSVLLTTIAAHPSNISDPVLLNARESLVNQTVDFSITIYASPNCDQGTKTNMNPLPSGALLDANHYDNQDASIPGFGAFSSFTPSRNVEDGEVIDFSMFGLPFDGEPSACSVYSQTMRPPILAGTCYPLDGPVTCFEIYHE